MKNPKISVIVPTYNAANYLKDFCLSIQNQSFKEFEVLLGDDASSDSSKHVIEPFLKDDRFKYIHFSRNAGVHHRTFQLLQMAKGDYWAYPGSDDLFDQTFLEKRYNTMESNPDVVLAHGFSRYIDSDGHRLEGDWQDIYLPKIATKINGFISGKRTLEMLLQHNFINTPSVLVRKSASDIIMPFFSPSWWWLVDWDLWILLASIDGGFHFDPVPVSSYRIHYQSNTHNPEKSIVRKIEGRLAPLVSLGRARLFSTTAMKLWSRYKDDLYSAWLLRATKLSKSKNLDQWMLDTAKIASGGNAESKTLLYIEILKNSLKIYSYMKKQKTHQKNQLFRVSGLASINDPAFLKH